MTRKLWTENSGHGAPFPKATDYESQEAALAAAFELIQAPVRVTRNGAVRIESPEGDRSR